MWKCPVCDQENNAATVCPTCGYDRTCDYERYPTAFTVKGAKSTRALRREWQEKQNPPPKSQPRPTAPPVAAPASVPTPAAAPAKKKSGLWKAIAVIAFLVAVGYVCSLLGSTATSGAGGAKVRYTHTDSYQGQVEVDLSSGGFGIQELAKARIFIDDCACTQLCIVDGVADASLMKQLAKLPNITKIHFSDCEKVADFDQLSGLDTLKTIEVSHVSDMDLTGMEDIASLRTLVISTCDSVDLHQLTNVNQLTTLEAIYSHITSLNGLEGLTSLKSLVLDNNQISDLKPLSNLTSLTLLQVRDNQISDLRPLSTLTNLYSLHISNNQITTLAGLENLTNLTYIAASGNPLTDTSALEVSGCMNALHMD